jgi:hypothetical protein
MSLATPFGMSWTQNQSNWTHDCLISRLGIYRLHCYLGITHHITAEMKFYFAGVRQKS